MSAESHGGAGLYGEPFQRVQKLRHGSGAVLVGVPIKLVNRVKDDEHVTCIFDALQNSRDDNGVRREVSAQIPDLKLARLKVDSLGLGYGQNSLLEKSWLNLEVKKQHLTLAGFE